MIAESKKTKASKLWLSMVVVFVVILNVSYVEAKSLKKGEEYREKDGDAIRVVSSDEVEIEQGPDIYLGKYTIVGERVRIVINALGTTMVRYYKITPDGLYEEKGGAIYYSSAGVAEKRNRAVLEAAKAADEEAKNPTTLGSAVAQGNVKMVKMFLAKGADVNAKDNYGNTVLSYAVHGQSTNIAIIKMLLAKGADVNAKTHGDRTDYFSTILIDAVKPNPYADNKTKKADINVRTEMVKMLLENGADISIKDSEGKTVFDHTHDPKMLEMLNKYAIQKTDKGAKDTDVKIKTMDLISAVQKGDTEIVKMLLDKGADVNAKDNNGNAALIWAVDRKNTEIIKMLLDKGADVNVDVNVKDGSREPVLIYAIKKDNTEIVKILLDNGADVKSRAANMALSYASIFKNIEIIKMLLDKGADARRSGGSDALIVAVIKNNIELVKMLIDKGADISERDIKGKTVLDYAKDPKILEVLNNHAAQKKE